MFIWQRPEWPRFRHEEARLGRVLANTRYAQGKLLGRMEALGFDMRMEAALRMLTEDVVKNSEIEGEVLLPDQVRSSSQTVLVSTWAACRCRIATWTVSSR